MKRSVSMTVLIPFLLVGCLPIRIVTESPSVTYTDRYCTVVTDQRAGVVSTTTQVIAASHDFSLDLDLQAIGAAFAQSSNVREFETLINDNAYMISNLDLNGDGYVDYLRVEEVYEGRNHLFVIQAVLGADIYQDVATVVVENPHLTTYSIEIVGAPYIYGPNYFVRPVFYTRPVILAYLCIPAYAPWHSPWCWGHFPPCYHRPAPVYLPHYQAYIDTFMKNHRYCHEVRYAEACHMRDYDRMYRGVQRNDYGSAHPERSFSVRNANMPQGNPAVSRNQQATNASDVRAVQKSTTNTSVTQIPRGSGTLGQSTRTSATGTSNRSSQPSVTGTSGQSVTRTATPQTTVHSNVRSSGSSSTRTKTTTPSGTTTTVRRGSTGSSSATRSTNTTSTRNSTDTHRR